MVVVIFRNRLRADIDAAEYAKTGGRMFELASATPGFISIRKYAADDGDAFSLVLFESAEALQAWRTNPEHLAAQQRARAEFYQSYEVQVLAPVREYAWERPA